MRWRKKSLQTAGDDQQWNGRGNQLDGFPAGFCEGIASPQLARKQDARAQAQACCPRKHDGWNLERTMRDHEGQQAPGHAVLRAAGQHRADLQSVVEKKPERSQPGSQASGKGHETDAHVVGHDAGGRLRFHRQHGIGPHLVVVDFVHHRRPQPKRGEVRTQQGDQHAEPEAGQKHRRGQQEIGKHAPQQARIAVPQELPQRPEGNPPAGVDKIVCAADKLVQVLFERARGRIGADAGQIGRRLPVQQTKFAQLWESELLYPAVFSLPQERFQTGPMILSAIDPRMSDHTCGNRNKPKSKEPKSNEPKAMNQAEERTFPDYGKPRPALDATGFERRSFADQLSIETPEQVALTFPVAGIGSRFVALLLDHLIQFGLVIVVLLLFVLVRAAFGAQHFESLGSKWFLALMIFFFFLLFWGYFALFEAFWRGQTPGKRAMQLRVIKDSGRQITLFESLARNLLRVADYLPSLYLAGVICMLTNRRNKRLGDLAAGTMVIHERAETQPLLYSGTFLRQEFSAPTPSDPWFTATAAASPFAANAAARLSHRDLAVIEAFFARSLNLPLEVRAAMAERILREMTDRMGVTVPDGTPERLLEGLRIVLRGLPRRS